MIDKVLTNLIYTFYPRGISFFTEYEKYIATKEYKRLKQIISRFDLEHREDLSKKILGYFEKDYTLKKIQDYSLLHIEDRCLTFNVAVIEDGELYTISLLISILAPYYVIKCQKNIIDLYFSKSEIAKLEKASKEKRKVKELILVIENIVEGKLLFNKFPKSMLDRVVLDVSFQEAEVGCFSMFNAFFNILIMTENEK